MKVKLDLPMYYGAAATLFEYAKEMRIRPTDGENALWVIVNSEAFGKYKFRRQHPISRFIADVYCHSLKLVIEVDGGYHLRQEQREFDSFRDEDMSALGISILRLTNDDILKNPESVKNIILDFISVLASTL